MHLLWGTRVIIPSDFWEAILAELHEAHPGMSRMKALARMYVWWPGITTDIKVTVRQCTECQVHQATPPQAPLQPWSLPSRPWSRLHLDYAGPVNGNMYLVLIDAHSKWVEAFCAASSARHLPLSYVPSLVCLKPWWQTMHGTCFVSAKS